LPLSPENERHERQDHQDSDYRRCHAECVHISNVAETWDNGVRDARCDQVRIRRTANPGSDG
jgi:hypothetical protein